MANSEFITPMPTGFTFSTATKKAIATKDKAWKVLQEYKLSNADYAPVRVANGYLAPAIRQAQEELSQLDLAAIRAGQIDNLPDKEAYLRPHKERAELFLRTQKALSIEYESAFRNAEDAITDDMPSLARKALEECAGVHKTWVAAVEAMGEAEARMNASVSRLVWAASDSRMNRSAGSGWADYTDTGAFEFTEDGRLTRKAAQVIGLETYQGGSAVAFDELVDWNGESPLHPQSDNAGIPIGESPMDSLRGETVYDVSGMSEEVYNRHFD